MDNEDNEDDEWVEVLKRSGLEGKQFEAKGVSRGEFEALKRFGIYKQLVDGTLMRIEGDKEYRIYCEDAEGWPVRVMTRGFCSMLSEAYDQMHARAANSASGQGPQRAKSDFLSV
jgi:hypothetical protein